MAPRKQNRSRMPRKTNNTRGALKKTTRKGAYKPVRKRNFQKRRAPFVETKKQEDVTVSLKAKLEGIVTDDTIRVTTLPLTISNGTRAGQGGTAIPNTITNLPLFSFLQMNQGLGASDINGLNVFSKYLKAKVSIELPSGSLAIKHPCDLYLVHGFITLPIGSTLHTDPITSEVTRSYVHTHIQEQLQQYFNQRSDALHFIPKQRSNVKILGYRKVKPNLNSNLGAPLTPLLTSVGQGTVSATAGASPLVRMTCKWPMMKKVPYSTGKDSLQISNDGLQHLFPNYSWLPFMVLYNPTALQFLDPNNYADAYEPKFQVRYNSAHYFSDS